LRDEHRIGTKARMVMRRWVKVLLAVVAMLLVAAIVVLILG